MKFTEEQIKQAVVDRLVEFLEVPASVIDTDPGVDAVVRVGSHTFVVQCKASGRPAPVSQAAEEVRQTVSRMRQRPIPLVAVPYMGQEGQEICEKKGVAWLDLSGNANISAPGLRILVAGQPDRFKGPGRPASAFAPKSSRVARWLLMHPDRTWSQREIARSTDVDEGFVSRITTRLEQDGLVARQPDGTLGVPDPDVLLDAWREAYHFSSHDVIRGHVPARSGEELLHRLGGKLEQRPQDYAATGLAAAWLLTGFASFRTATFYLDRAPDPAMLDGLSFREGPQGANVWLAIPKDEGVFQGVAIRKGVACVHPVQAYLDLGGHPERAAEAGERLRSELLRWKADA